MKKKLVYKGKFEKVMKSGEKVSSGGLTIFVARGRGQVGVSTKKGIKGAVKRNRIKRQLREYARKNLLGQLAGKTVILIAADPNFKKGAVKL